jgi:hypothetical protein
MCALATVKITARKRLRKVKLTRLLKHRVDALHCRLRATRYWPGIIPRRLPHAPRRHCFEALIVPMTLASARIG